LSSQQNLHFHYKNPNIPPTLQNFRKINMRKNFFVKLISRILFCEIGFTKKGTVPFMRFLSFKKSKHQFPQKIILPNIIIYYYIKNHSYLPLQEMLSKIFAILPDKTKIFAKFNDYPFEKKVVYDYCMNDII